MSEPKAIEVLITLPFDEQQVGRLRAVNSRLRVHQERAKKVEDITAEQWSKTEVLYTDLILPAPEQVPMLKWIQFHYAGIDFAVDSPLMNKDGVQFTTLSGAAAPQMAEFAITMMLALGHNLPDLASNQSKAEWPHNRWERFHPQELRGSTVGLIGYGSIAREIARLLLPFHVKVLAAKRDAMHPEDHGYTPQNLGDPEGNLFHRLYPIEALGSMINDCDFIVVTLPLTEETRDLIGSEKFKQMKNGACLVDIGRGGVVNQRALLDALQDHRLGGAALDVFAEEPLPADNPLWKAPNVIISPHIGGMSHWYNDRAVDLFIENLNRYLGGTSLLNRFDRERGY